MHSYISNVFPGAWSLAHRRLGGTSIAVVVRCVVLLAIALVSEPTHATAQSSTPTPPVAPVARDTGRSRTDSVVMMAELTPQQGNLADLLKTHIAKAKALGRTPFVELWATWCENCVILDKSLHDARMIEAFAGTYLIRLNVDQWDKTLLNTLGVSGDQGVPAIYAVDSTGVGTGPDITVNMSGWTPEGAPDFKAYFRKHLWP